MRTIWDQYTDKELRDMLPGQRLAFQPDVEKELRRREAARQAAGA